MELDKGFNPSSLFLKQSFSLDINIRMLRTIVCFQLGACLKDKRGRVSRGHFLSLPPNWSHCVVTLSHVPSGGDHKQPCCHLISQAWSTNVTIWKPFQSNDVQLSGVHVVEKWLEEAGEDQQHWDGRTWQVWVIRSVRGNLVRHWGVFMSIFNTVSNLHLSY